MLHLQKVLAAKPKEHTTVQLHPLFTPWGETLDPAHVLAEHPTPQFMRPNYHMLNGVWQCAFEISGHTPTENMENVVRQARFPHKESFSTSILVPFSPESLLSGVGRKLQPDELLWYKRSFEAPAHALGARILLHFQAVDYACAVWVNSQMVGTHIGGYTPFVFDITQALCSGENTLAVCVADPSELGQQPRGKQRLDRGDIWYTAQSGIWQPVWLEVVPENYIQSARIQPELVYEGGQTAGILSVGFCLALGASKTHGVNTETIPHTLYLEVLDGGKVVAKTECQAEKVCATSVYLPHVQPWSPQNPYLYTLRFTFGNDVVESYCAFRSVEVRKDSTGQTKIFLNHEPFFIKGVLDQGYWSDGLLSAPSDEALVFDIESMRAAGFNTLRKHIKVENERWYYHCDRLGMLVWQDMVSGGAAEINSWQFSYKPTLFKFSWDHFPDTIFACQRWLGAGSAQYQQQWLQGMQDTIELLGGHPCIVAWTLFNEGWGQFNSRAACQLAQKLDPTRPICATSGWYDQGAGHIRGVHNYFRDHAVWHAGLHGRAFVLTEFGGYAHHVEGHSALDEVYGYEVYETAAEWLAQTKALLAEIAALEKLGLAGFVLTQLSDIEEETNGILTYDRKVNKLEGFTFA